jgi:hypothetical protein
MTASERQAYQRGRRDGTRVAEQRIERQVTFMQAVNSDLIEAIAGGLSDDQQRAAELHERRLKGL